MKQRGRALRVGLPKMEIAEEIAYLDASAARAKALMKRSIARPCLGGLPGLGKKR